jgi:hypothetical protein
MTAAEAIPKILPQMAMFGSERGDGGARRSFVFTSNIFQKIKIFMCILVLKSSVARGRDRNF